MGFKMDGAAGKRQEVATHELAWGDGWRCGDWGGEVARRGWPFHRWVSGNSRLVGSVHYIRQVPSLTDEQPEHLFNFLISAIPAIGEVTEFSQIIPEVA
jgi:hypothetical protein